MISINGDQISMKNDLTSKCGSKEGINQSFLLSHSDPDGLIVGENQFGFASKKLDDFYAETHGLRFIRYDFNGWCYYDNEVWGKGDVRISIEDCHGDASVTTCGDVRIGLDKKGLYRFMPDILSQSVDGACGRSISCFRVDDSGEKCVAYITGQEYDEYCDMIADAEHYEAELLFRGYSLLSVGRGFDVSDSDCSIQVSIVDSLENTRFDFAKEVRYDGQYIGQEVNWTGHYFMHYSHKAR